MKITFLGTGTSHGVPSIDCMMHQFTDCPQGVCRESQTDHRHRRTRSSILLRWNDKTILIDAGPDLREQCLRERISAIDAVLITHAHADHIFGIPDLRSYTKDKELPLYGSPESVGVIRSSFSYIFNPATLVGGGIPRIAATAIDAPFELFGQVVTPIAVDHLQLDGCFGYRIGPVSYLPDIKRIDEREVDKLVGTRLLILNCLRRSKEHVSHLILPQSIELARRIAPEKCYFIHMSHDIHYKADKQFLDAWMDFSWDGLSVKF
jgi:phosphoribosyl 1,2-cyclic phosphate phosphodiesterase